MLNEVYGYGNIANDDGGFICFSNGLLKAILTIQNSYFQKNFAQIRILFLNNI